MFVGHDVEHHLVGLVHAFRADEGKVADAPVHVLFDNALYGSDALLSIAIMADITQ